MQFIILLLFIPIFWVLIIRPQQQQRRAHHTVVTSLEVGDKVMTVGGLIGTLTEVEEETVRLDTGTGAELTFGRTFIRQRVDESPAVDQTPDESDDEARITRSITQSNTQSIDDGAKS